MSDLLEHDLREALAERAARITPQASERVRAVAYRPRLRRRAPRRVVAAVGLSGVAAAAGAVVLLASSAAPAFAGWTAKPTTPRPGQLAAADQACGAGSPVLTDTRGPFTAAIYANGSTCVDGNGIQIRSDSSGGGASSLPAGTIDLNGLGQSDSDGHALTMVDGRIGAGVTGVTIARSDGSSVQATVGNGWYLAWWPGSEHAVTASVATAGGSNTQSFPAGPQQPAQPCPAGAQCSSGYGFGSGHGAMGSTVSRGAGSSSSSGR